MDSVQEPKLYLQWLQNPQYMNLSNLIFLLRTPVTKVNFFEIIFFNKKHTSQKDSIRFCTNFFVALRSSK